MAVQADGDKSSKSQSAASKLNPGVVDHLQKVVDLLMRECPDNPMSVFETTSRMVRSSAPNSVHSSFPSEWYTCLNNKVASTINSLALPVAKPAEDDPTAPREPLPLASVQNIATDLDILRQCGVGFSESETYEITTSVRQLAAKVSDASMQEQIGGSVSKIRFWGKLLTRSSGAGICDYYVAECEGSFSGVGGGSNASDDPSQLLDLKEERGSGVNRFVYFVKTSNNSLDWTMLPDVTPEQIRVARQVKYLLTGDVKNVVHTYPPFPGNEGSYIRTQIARISSSTYVAPVGFYALSDPDDPVNSTVTEASPPEEEQEKNTKQLAASDPEKLVSLKSWVYAREYILSIGRTLYPELPPEPEPLEEGKPAPKEHPTLAFLRRLQKSNKDPVPSKLRTIDQTTDGAAASRLLRQNDKQVWSIRFIGNNDRYVTSSSKSASDQQQQPSTVFYHGKCAVTNTAWPGATVAYTLDTSNGIFGKQNFVHVYVGYGLKATRSKKDEYYIREPPSVCSDDNVYVNANRDKEQNEPRDAPAPPPVQEGTDGQTNPQ